MKPARSIGQALLWCVHGLGSFALWTLWLALAVLLVTQCFILFKSELAVPDLLLRRAERQIAESGFRVSFARTSFDPNGHVLLEDVRLSLPEYAEPVLAARAIYLEFNPWALAIGQLNPRELRIIDGRATVPAMLSPSGEPQSLVEQLDATFLAAEKQVRIAQFSARVAGLNVSARGALALVRARRVGDPPRPFVEIVSTQFPRWARQAISLAQQIEPFEAPSLDLAFTPHEVRGATVDATLLARTLRLNTPLATEVRNLRLVTSAPLLGEAPASSRLELQAEEIRLPLRATAYDVHTVLLGRFQPGGFQFTPDEMQLSAGRLEASGFSATAVAARLLPGPLPQLEGEVVANVMGAPLVVRGNTNLETRTARLRFSGVVSPQVLTPLGALLKIDVRRFFDFGALACEAGDVQLGPDWKFQKLNARVALRDIFAYRVRMSEGGATLELDPQRLSAPDAFARIGDNFARGSYEQNLRTREFRFLLDGRLRPLDISGWFREWWPRFFQMFDFSAAIPAASVDVQGIWRQGRDTAVFVAADAAEPVIRGGTFDRVRTRLFVRPAFVDCFDLLAESGEGLARGSFTYRSNPVTNAWRQLDLDLVSTVDLPLAGKITPPVVTSLLEQFKFDHPPTVKLQGRIDSADAPGGAHQTLQLEVGGRGAFHFNGFPLDDISFLAAVRDDEIVLDHISATLGGGNATGRAKIWGNATDRRVGFDLALKGASLGRAAAALQEFTAFREKRAPEPPGKYMKEKAAVRLDLAASAEGLYANPFSYRGDGHAMLEGEEIGELPLLGLLSELLRFTALRFTTARGNFKIDGARLAFSELAVRGGDAAIDAHGDYWLDRRELDFNAKLFPFQESGNVLKTVVGVVLSPISNVFEVKLSGSPEKPKWAFLIGPTNLFRTLAESPNAPTATDTTTGPSTPSSAPAPAAPPEATAK